MGESETISWIKSQLNAGYSRSRIKEMLINSGNDPENADKLLDLAAGQDPGNGNSAPIAAGSDIAHEQKKEVHEDSWIKVGLHAGACALIVSAVAGLTMMFFDNYRLVGYAFLIVIFEASVIANSSQKASFKKIVGSAVVSYFILWGGLMFLMHFFISYIFSVSIFEVYSQVSQVSNFIGGFELENYIIMLIIAAVLGIVALQIFTFIMWFSMKRLKIPKINVLKPIAIFAILYFAAIGVYSFTGEKIVHEPIEVYWCNGNNGDVCDAEDAYEMGLKMTTGYTYESYFTKTPNTHNLLSMNKYMLATGLLSMINFVSIRMEGLYTTEFFDDMDLYDVYFDNVVKRSSFDLDEIKNVRGKNPEEAVLLCIEGYNSYLGNLKKMVNEYDIDYSEGGKRKPDKQMFRNKEQHLEYIQRKIDINNGLKESYKSIKLNIDDDFENTYYARNTQDTVKQSVETCIKLFDDISVRVKITDVSFGSLEGSETKKVEINIKNVGLTKIEYEPKYISVYVNGRPVVDVECTFKLLKVDEEGVCSGTIKDDEDFPRIITVSLPAGPHATYLYEKS
ncbi:MAG: Yip1 family protein [archaeon]|nr:Yip1 family protein [archaeon]